MRQQPLQLPGELQGLRRAGDVGAIGVGRLEVGNRRLPPAPGSGLASVTGQVPAPDLLRQPVDVPSVIADHPADRAVAVCGEVLAVVAKPKEPLLQLAHDLILGFALGDVAVEDKVQGGRVPATLLRDAMPPQQPHVRRAVGSQPATWPVAALPTAARVNRPAVNDRGALVAGRRHCEHGSAPPEEVADPRAVLLGEVQEKLHRGHHVASEGAIAALLSTEGLQRLRVEDGGALAKGQPECRARGPDLDAAVGDLDSSTSEVADDSLPQRIRGNPALEEEIQMQATRAG